VPAREINNPIDRLAAIRDQIKKLQKDEKELTEAVRKLGDGEHDGDKVRAVITTTTPERLDTDAIRAAMPDEWVKRFTKSSPQTTVRFKPLV
jgi:Arc/MetJ-type ribon-helix-helix transcriptional regulator